MKTYRNDHLGFELDVPEKWSFPASGASESLLGNSITFRCEYFESFKLLIRPMSLPPVPGQMEDKIRSHVQNKNYTSLVIGKITVAGKEHIWARYYQGSGQWTKEYRVVRSGIEYTFIANCFYQNRLVERERVWDSVVISFRLRKASTEVISSQMADLSPVEQQSRAGKMPGRTNTYRNEIHGFEIDIPDDWYPYKQNRSLSDIPFFLKFGSMPQIDIAFSCSPNEFLNIVVESMTPEPSLEFTENYFKLYAQQMGFTDLNFGRIIVGGKQHTWARYRFRDSYWSKKYMIILGGKGYAITASCNSQKIIDQRETVWDTIAQSFRMLGPATDSQSKHFYPAADSYIPGKLPEQSPVPTNGKAYTSSESSLDSSNNVWGVKDGPEQDYTLGFSMLSYLIIEAVSFFYIYAKVGCKTLLSLIDETDSPLSSVEFFTLWVLIIFGIGAFICLMYLLGVVLSEKHKFRNVITFDFIRRTMLMGDQQNKTLGEWVFSDYSRMPNGIFDTLGLQIKSLIHALTKIFFTYLAIGLANRVLMIALLILFALVFILPDLLGYSLPAFWGAVYFIAHFLICYWGFHSHIARQRGVGIADDFTGRRQIVLRSSFDSWLQSVSMGEMTLEFITQILEQECIIHTIQSDLEKTTYIGYAEMWRLGLITPDEDKFGPFSDLRSRQEGMKKILEDTNFRLNLVEQIPLKRTAILNNIGSFNIQSHNLVITGGTQGLMSRGLPLRIYNLKTELYPNKFINIRQIQMEDRLTFDEYRSHMLPKFLQEDGFPLKEVYPDGDPLTTERGGIIVIAKGKVIIIYPQYFVQRSLIDDDGNLIYLGLDECLRSSTKFDVKVRPSVSELLFKRIQSNGYIPILRYRSFPYVSDYMLPILDTPMSASGWADLFIDPTGKAKLFIAREKTVAEWYEMMGKLKQLFYVALAREDHHLLGLVKDKFLLNQYLSQKQRILEDYFFIQDWSLC